MNHRFNLCAAAAMIALTGCGRNETPSESSAQPAAPPIAPAAPTPAPVPAASTVPTSATPLPAYPAWATALIGQDTTQGFTKSASCVGAFDAVTLKHISSPSGVEAAGWGWLTGQKTAPAKIVFVNAAGVIVGAGTTATDRPDVEKAVPGVTVLKTGWIGEIGQPSGDITAMALMPGEVLCPLGTPKTM